MCNDAPLLIDVSRLIWRRWTRKRPTGIDRVCLAYLEHFAPRSQAVIQGPRFRRILDRRTSRTLFDLLLDGGKDFRLRLIALATKHILSASSSLPGNRRPYLNVGHTGLDRPEFHVWVRHADVQPIYMVHDLIPITHPQYCRLGEADKHRLRMRTALETGTGIIGNSQATLDALNSFATSQELPKPPQISAWLGGAQLRLATDTPPPFARPYFVMLGTIEGRKNHSLLLDIWLDMIREHGASAPTLRIIGQRGWEADTVFAMLDSNGFLRGHVIEINDCPDDELALHLVHARALLFPSMVEGYGLPLIEALGAGVPVICSNIPIFREIAGDIPDYLDPMDSLGWKQLINSYAAARSIQRSAQLLRLTNYRMPDWQMHFSTIDRWLENLCDPRPFKKLEFMPSAPSLRLANRLSDGPG